jgi:signal transduction histidine kinase
VIRRSLTAKLFAAQLLVIVAGSVTLALVALSLAPGLFHRHVRDALGVVPADVARHLDEAFADAVLLALAVAIAAAAVTAGAVSLFVSRRIVRPVARLGDAASRVARGHYGERVPIQGADELGRLGAAFNAMAAALESAEERRRRLLADLAHELRTPLATIDGYLEGLADGVVAATPETWTVMRRESTRLRRLVDDLQKVSRAEERQLDLDLEDVAPAALVEAAVAAASPAYVDRNVDLRAEVASNLPLVRADVDRIAEVLANLLDNALRHTPAGGRVTVSAERHAADVVIAVTDTGEGIPHGELERIFERFYRTDAARSRDRGGSGIGLTISRAIVQAHGGRLTAETGGPGRGSRFALALPGAGNARY